MKEEIERWMRYIVFLFMLQLLLSLPPVYGAIINAASCSSANVQSSINSALNGDKVLVPAGTCTWTSGINIGSKAVTLQGAGIGLTNIIHQVSGSQAHLINFQQNRAVTTRVTGFSFSNANYDHRIIECDGSYSSAPFRVDHNSFTASVGPTIFVDIFGGCNGLIDRNDFTAPDNSEMIHNWGPGISGWSDDIIPGSPDALYVEDNIFTNSGNAFNANSALQSYDGSRTVVRHNTFHDSQVDQHGGVNIGARWWEFYENTFDTKAGYYQDKYFDIRAGSGVIFNNHKTGASSNAAIVLREDSSYQVGHGKNDALDPAYIWGNDATMPVDSRTGVQANQDYYLLQKPGYAPYTYPHPLTLTSSSTDSIIPETRRIDWSNVGISGGIPSRTTICATINTATYGNGITDATSTIQSAINNCPSGQVVYLPAGKYRLSGISITKGVVLRGEGVQSRLLVYGSGIGIKMGQGSGGTAINLIGSYTKGSSKISMSSTSGINVGDHVVVDEVSPSFVDNPRSYLCEDRSGAGYGAGKRCIAQINKVADKTGTTLTLEHPLYFDYSSSLNPRVYTWSMVENAGLETLHIERAENVGDSSSHIIQLYACSNCWVKGVETYRGRGDHIQLWYSSGNVIKDNFVNVGWNDYTPPDFGYDSGRNYGIHIAWGPGSDNLIENNIVNSTRHGLIMEGNENGNVISYNYVLNGLVYDDPTWNAGDASNHGAYPYMNLWEGNYIHGRLSFDHTHGGGSHNTIFRNLVTRGPAWKTGGTWAIDIQQSQWYANVIGNVLGYPGFVGVLYAPANTNQEAIYRLGHPDDGSSSTADNFVGTSLIAHGNFDYATNAINWNPNILSQSIPDSLYRGSKPLWFGSLAWPAFGPDPTNPSQLLNGNIPAKKCYDDMSLQNLPFDAARCYSGTGGGFDFSLSNGGSKSVIQGQSNTNSITSTLSSGTTQSVSFSATGLPTGATASYSPTSCSPTCATTITINTLSTTPTGTYAINVNGVGGGVTKTTSFSLTVNSASTNTITIGETNILTSGDNANANLLLAQQATLSQTATIQSLSFYVMTASGKLRLGIYDATGPNGGPGAKKAETNEIIPIVGWNTAPVITPVLLPAGTYWLAYLPNDNNLAFVKGDGPTSYFYTYNYGTMPTTFSTALSSTSSHWSLYATLNTGTNTNSCSWDFFPRDIPDGKVTLADILVIVGDFGKTSTSPGFNPKMDYNNNNQIDLFDVLSVVAHFGGCNV